MTSKFKKIPNIFIKLVAIEEEVATYYWFWFWDFQEEILVVKKNFRFLLSRGFFWSLEVDKQELQERKVLLYDDDRLLNSVAVLGVVKTKKESVEHFSLIIVKRCRNYWVAHHCRKWILTKDKKEEEQQQQHSKCAKTCHQKSCTKWNWDEFLTQEGHLERNREN